MRSDDKPIRPEVLAALVQLPQVQKELRAAAKDVQRKAKQLAPKTSGNLRKNIEIEREPAGDYVVGWNKRAFYGSQVELGHEAEPPRPHLVPAVIATETGGA